MYPNGMMNVWTGLLLRVENEDQLVAVLGHEIGHYLRAHQIERWRSMRNSASVAIFFDMVLTAGLATLAVASNSMAFGRDQELEADQFGVGLMGDKHYDPAEAVALWQYVAEEQSKDSSKSKQSMFFATHPQPKERIEALEQLAVQNGHVEDNSHSEHQEQFLSIMSLLYFDYMNDHFSLQENEQTALMLEKHLELGYPKGQVYYFKGRLANQENTEESRFEAEKYFLESVSQQGAPPESYRELGYLYLKNGDKKKAGEFFQQYLNARPEASDIKMIEFYLNSME
jgi:predicted Zn-dependent protease